MPYGSDPCSMSPPGVTRTTEGKQRRSNQSNKFNSLEARWGCCTMGKKKKKKNPSNSATQDQLSISYLYVSGGWNGVNVNLVTSDIPFFFFSFVRQTSEFQRVKATVSLMWSLVVSDCIVLDSYMIYILWSCTLFRSTGRLIVVSALPPWISITL